MLQTEELADGIIQITNRGAWTMETWAACSRIIVEQTEARIDPIYMLINITGTTALEEAAFVSCLTAPHFGMESIALAILVGRRGQVLQARELLNAHPTERDHVQLRLMYNLNDAINVLLDRQVMDRVNGARRHGQ